MLFLCEVPFQSRNQFVNRGVYVIASIDCDGPTDIERAMRELIKKPLFSQMTSTVVQLVQVSRVASAPLESIQCSLFFAPTMKLDHAISSLAQ